MKLVASCQRLGEWFNGLPFPTGNGLTSRHQFCSRANKLKLIMVMDLRKVTGVMLLTLMIFSYVSFRTEWNYFMFIQMIQFFQFIDLSLEYWVFLDRYVFNGAL